MGSVTGLVPASSEDHRAILQLGVRTSTVDLEGPSRYLPFSNMRICRIIKLYHAELLGLDTVMAEDPGLDTKIVEITSIDE